MLEKYKEICKDIANGMPPGGLWQWEGRFGVALTVFEKVDMQSVLGALERNFDHQWDAETVKNSDATEVGSLVENVFGIEPGQLLFSRDTVSGPLLFAAWWPWGNGVSISLRIGIYNTGNTEEIDTAQYLIEWFGI